MKAKNKARYMCVVCGRKRTGRFIYFPLTKVFVTSRGWVCWRHTVQRTNQRRAAMTFGKQPFVAAGCAAGTPRDASTGVPARGAALEDLQRFEAEWRREKTVNVRKFRREVRAGGCSLPVITVVVRRKVAPAAE